VGLQAGETYLVTITDGNGCSSTNSVTIPNPEPVVVNLVGMVHPGCHDGEDGGLSVEGSGGTAPYSYTWAHLQTGPQVSGLSAGTPYTVTVTDAKGCSASATYTLNNTSDVELEMFGNDLLCADDSTGMVSVVATGGILPHTYAWSSGETTDNLSNVMAGTYTVTVTDANGCSQVDSISVTAPAPLTISATAEGVSCHGFFDGSVIISAEGGTYPLSYSLDGENYNGVSHHTGLAPGYYPAYLQDGNGCTAIVDSLWVTEPLPVEVTIYPDTSVVSIPLGDSIQLSVDYSNTVGEIIVDWIAQYGENISCTDCLFPWITDTEFNQYTVTIIDENGCVGEDQIAVEVPRDRGIFVPSGFTPNGDFINDALMVHGTSGTKVTTFRVYDRWGELVFRADDYMVNSQEPEVVWDGTFKGKEMNPAVFVWYVEVEYVDGHKESFNGNSTLLR
jgi:gliding motility-associated-like protein